MADSSFATVPAAGTSTAAISACSSLTGSSSPTLTTKSSFATKRYCCAAYMRYGSPTSGCGLPNTVVSCLDVLISIGRLKGPLDANPIKPAR